MSGPEREALQARCAAALAEARAADERASTAETQVSSLLLKIAEAEASRTAAEAACRDIELQAQVRTQG